MNGDLNEASLLETIVEFGTDEKLTTKITHIKIDARCRCDGDGLVELQLDGRWICTSCRGPWTKPRAQRGTAVYPGRRDANARRAYMRAYMANRRAKGDDNGKGTEEEKGEEQGA